MIDGDAIHRSEDTGRVPVWERKSNIRSRHYILKELLQHASGIIQ